MYLNKCKSIAISKGGACLSKKYINMHIKMTWRCSHGHKWKATPCSIIHQGSWCAKCSGRYIGNINQMKKLAKDHGGKCLSIKYLNSRTKLRWKCREGHTWWATPENIKGNKSKKGTWCPLCSNNAPLDLRGLKKIAKERGGKLISEKYKNIKTPLLWECHKGHRWKVAASGIVHNGTWCPICNINIGEEICREIFEKLFVKKFPSMRPKWLISNKGYLPGPLNSLETFSS